MIKEIEKAKEGYEKVVEVFDGLILNIEESKAEEIAQIEQKYAERLDKYTADRANYVEVELVEVPDEVEETEEIVVGGQEIQMGDTASDEFQSV